MKLNGFSETDVNVSVAARLWCNAMTPDNMRRFSPEATIHCDPSRSISINVFLF